MNRTPSLNCVKVPITRKKEVPTGDLLTWKIKKVSIGKKKIGRK